ncbi:MAG: creatininase family protein [Candidatus Aminicenantales bacterium]
MKIRTKRLIRVVLLAGVGGALAVGAVPQDAVNPAPPLSTHYEELTAPDFIKAVAASQGTCIIPVGILEKHGPHLPLGTDLFECRETSLRAAGKEYAIVFPAYYFGQIFEARHQPGTIAYSSDLILDLLQETCDELARNGLKKIILVNGHGGSEQMMQYFCQIQLARKKDYAVFLFQPEGGSAREKELDKMRRTTLDGHAGEMETSQMLVIRPELVHLDRADEQSGEDQNRLAGLKHAYTGIWWYAKTPNHYLGFGAAGRKELGEASFALEADLLAEMIRSVKSDETTLALQKRFFEEAEKPLATPQKK